MPDIPTTALGWASKKAAVINFWRCPNCNQSRDMLFSGDSGLVNCYGCGASLPFEGWKDAKRLGLAAVCQGCGKNVLLTNLNLCMATGCHHICPGCLNVVSVVCDENIVHPQDVLDPHWNPGLVRRADHYDGWSFAVCRSKKDFAVARLLNLIARDEDSRFIYGRDQEHKVGVGFDEQGYFGYVMWTFKTMPVLRQIFVLKERQRKGLGSRMLRYWAERYAFPYVEQFGVEDPNEKSMELYLKLGYVRREGGKIVGVKLERVPWGFE
jgi:GNAT superfamily N-acetyltransferase